MILVSGLAGGLLGVERELKVNVLAGTRTFAFASMLGAVSVFLAKALNLPELILMSFFGFIVITTIMALVKNFRSFDFGVTTPIAFLLAFTIGLLIGNGMYFEGIASSIIITSVLIFKGYTTWLSDTLTHDEMRSALEFGIIAFILYPVVPNTPIDPYGLIIPKTLILVVIVVSSIGFSGFLALRKLGPERGLPMVGALGGLVNSEATTSALANKVCDNRVLTPNAIQGILYSNSVMFIRNLVIAVVVSPTVALIMAGPHVIMSASGAVYGKLQKMTTRTEHPEIQLESPFAIKPSIRFGILFTIISFAVDFLKDFGTGGIYFTSMVGGIISSAAVTASVTSFAATGNIDAETAAYACIFSSMTSTITKLLLAKISGPAGFARKLVPPVVLIIVIGLLALFGVYSLV